VFQRQAVAYGMTKHLVDTEIFMGMSPNKLLLPASRLDNPPSPLLLLSSLQENKVVALLSSVVIPTTKIISIFYRFLPTDMNP